MDDEFRRNRRLPRITEDNIARFLSDFKADLIAKDVNIDVASLIVDRINDRIKKRAGDNRGKGDLQQVEFILAIVYQEIVNSLGGQRVPDRVQKGKENIIVTAGLGDDFDSDVLNQIVRYYMKCGLKIALIYTSNRQSEVNDQRIRLDHQSGFQFYINPVEKNPVNLAIEGIDLFLNQENPPDLVIVDTTGFDGDIISYLDVLSEMEHSIKPNETLYAINAGFGQKSYSVTLPVATALTNVSFLVKNANHSPKFLGTLFACSTTGKKVKFVSNGKNPDEIGLFSPQAITDSLFNIPNIRSILEAFDAIIPPFDVDAQERLARAEPTLEDFFLQMQQFKRLSTIKLLETLGMENEFPNELLEVSDETISLWKSIASSMTVLERSQPGFIPIERLHQLAIGAGVTMASITDVITRYRVMTDFLRRIRENKEKMGMA